MSTLRRAVLVVATCAIFGLTTQGHAQPDLGSEAASWASQCVIYRDAYGVPHIDAQTDAAAAFGFVYAQCEDYFWQVEDNFILSLGRYSEVHGDAGIAGDLLNRAFEIVPSSKRDFQSLDNVSKSLCVASAAALNHFLQTHPEVEPRLISHFEPWHLLALNRHLSMEQLYRFAKVDQKMPRMYGEMDAARGSNAFAIAPSKTKDGNAILLINPHQPYFDFGQFWEGHVRSAEDGGWNYSGATFFGAPLPILGWNEHLGWAMTTNRPDCADGWVVKFDVPDRPLAYRYGKEIREATEWKETIKVRVGDAMQERSYTFRKTHHGPCTKKIDNNTWVAVRIAKLYEGFTPTQFLAMAKSKSLDDFKAALSSRNFQYQNMTVADRMGNIFYIYYGAIPKRDPKFDWNSFVDGNDPATEWQGFHEIAELPQLLNPADGYLQNCNSSPFVTTDTVNPLPDDFPNYMVEDRWIDERRSRIARTLLRKVEQASYEDVVRLAYDTTMFWAMNEIPKFQQRFADLESSNPQLAQQVKPYLDHFQGWDFRAEPESTQAPLCHAWYEEMYGFASPARVMKKEYVDNVEKRFEALVKAARKLDSLYGSWKVQWADIYRLQRHREVVGFIRAPFNDNKESIPCLGVPGPIGSIFTVHYMPAISVPLLRTAKKRYGMVGNSFMAVIEFGPKIRASSVLQFGQSSDARSPNYFDQAQLMSERKLKPCLFYWDDVQQQAVRRYRPGETSQASAKLSDSAPKDSPRAQPTASPSGN